MTRNIIKALAVLALLILSLVILSPFLSAPPSGHNTQKHLHYARQIVIACRNYASDHDEGFPKQLDDLFPDYIDSKYPLIETFSKKRMWTYHPGSKFLIEVDPDKNLVIESNFRIKKGVISPLSEKNAKKIYGFSDGSITTCTDKMFTVRFQK